MFGRAPDFWSFQGYSTSLSLAAKFTASVKTDPGYNLAYVSRDSLIHFLFFLFSSTYLDILCAMLSPSAFWIPD